MFHWWKKRKKPYTEIGIHRLKCCKCGGPGFSQWSICADGNNHRVLCLECDIDLNRLVLEWIDHPQRHLLIDRYSVFQRARMKLNV